jgi:hypothetical protein
MSEEMRFLLLSDVAGIATGRAKCLDAGTIITQSEFDREFDRRSGYLDKSYRDYPGAKACAYALDVDDSLSCLYKATAELGIRPVYSFAQKDLIIWSLVRVALDIPKEEMVRYAGAKTSCKELDTLARARLQGLI